MKGGQNLTIIWTSDWDFSNFLHFRKWGITCLLSHFGQHFHKLHPFWLNGQTNSKHRFWAIRELQNLKVVARRGMINLQTCKCSYSVATNYPFLRNSLQDELVNCLCRRWYMYFSFSFRSSFSNNFQLLSKVLKNCTATAVCSIP